jgi:aspartyl-tRNA(Asn)/glutamyl-tRNA(Gln) amidotransferase subunit A
MVADVRRVAQDGPLAQARSRLRAGATSSAALVREALERAEAAAGSGAFVTLCHSEAGRAAAAADEELARGVDRGFLHGLPVALKDNIAVRGVALRANSAVLEGSVATADAAVVEWLHDAGAVVIGKTALDEFAFATVGTGIANPAAPGFSAGGSSGGSAAAVAAGVCGLALGTDTGGSVRIPAACCRVVGFKPSIGALPTAGVIPLSWTLDHVGLLTRTVGDAAASYLALLGTPTDGGLPARSTRLRIGVPAGDLLDVAVPPVREAFDAVIDGLRAGGAGIAEVALPSTDVGLHLQYLIVLSEAAAYHRAAYGDAGGYGDGVREAIAWGSRVDAVDYLDAQRARSRLRRAVDAALRDVDALLLPTLPVPPPASGREEVTLGDGRTEDVVSAMLRLTCPFNHSGHPAVSLPSRPAGHEPLGVQLVGRLGADLELLAVAAALEDRLQGG